MAQKRNEFIEEFKGLVSTGEITDIESYAYKTRASRTKAVSDLRAGDHEEILIGKRGVFIKKEE